MKHFDQINRRLHLYLGLFLVPWMMVYGFSSVMISHPALFRSESEPPWHTVFEREYHREVPEQGDLRKVAQAILADCQLEGAFWTDRPNPRVMHIDRFRFWDDTRLTYLIPEGKLRAERRDIPWRQVVMRLHFRGGFLQPTFWDDLWAVFVDLVCVGILIWVVSGLVMWWRLAKLRRWGAIAIGGGVVSFLLFLWQL